MACSIACASAGKGRGCDVDIHPRFEPIRYLSICTGGGGLDLSLELAISRSRPVAYVEREAFACAHLVAAMEQGLLAPRLCGAMPEPSLAGASEAAWIASLGESHASRIPLPESGSGGTMSAISGPRCEGSSSRPARGARSSKTSPAWSHPAGLPASGETFTGWVLRLRQDSSVRKRLVRAMAARGSSCLPSINPPSQGEVWPTATANDFKGSGPTLMRKDGRMRGDRLDYAAEQIWSTQTAHDGRRPGLDIYSPQGTNLSRDVGVWPTIRAAEAGGYQYSRGNRNKPVPTLTGAGTAWSTPSIADVTGGRMSRSGDRSDEALMKRQAEMVATNLAATLANGLSSRPARATSYGAPSRLSILSAFQRYRAMTCSSMRAEMRALIRMAIRAERAGQRRGFTRPSYRKSLNARFVVWLMGWPDHWTRTALMPSACSAMALSLWRARMLSELSALPLPGDMAPIQPDLFGGWRD